MRKPSEIAAEIEKVQGDITSLEDRIRLAERTIDECGLKKTQSTEALDVLKREMKECLQ